MAVQTMALPEGIRKGPKNKGKYEFTPLIDDLIRRAYRQYRVYGNRTASVIALGKWKSQLEDPAPGPGTGVDANQGAVLVRR
jgi:hypothetical protein